MEAYSVMLTERVSGPIGEFGMAEVFGGSCPSESNSIPGEPSQPGLQRWT